eukprot:TRINITY_DN5316_c0_g2_i1.p1 TRINITY_DN5316_c0_g2~~TRINITY_DN5316_c0_g2_i1.p1  ORF type:complete len:537 (+),score=132.92 TRINITY_DN5316_c0_g2_i1:73-1611(+)
MEFERALFRVHQRTLQAESTRKVRLAAERVLPWAILGFGLALTVLHSEYVGQAQCLPRALRRAGLWNETSGAPSLPDDAVLALVIVPDSESYVQDEEALLGDGVTLHMRAAAAGGAAGAKQGAAATAGGSSGSELQRALQDGALARYRFAVDRDLMLLRASVFKAHGFRMLNVTVQEGCFMGSLVWRGLFRLFDVYDVIVINELAYTFRSKGYLERFSGDARVGWEAKSRLESWAWSAEQVEAASPLQPRWLLPAAVRKALLLAKAAAAVLLISATTGYFIRVAVNGSAVLMFPMAIAAQRYGSGRVSIGLLTRSFPWIGVHIEVLRRAGRPLGPLFKSHLTFLFLQSFAYLSCNLAWRFVIYRKSSPEGFEERIFSFCSLLELYNLLFVRSGSTIAVFPALSCAAMVYLHFYLFCSLYPFHTLAFGMCACVCLYVMAYCLNHFEEPALRGDPYLFTTPTLLHPRACYMPQLSPSWSLESAPLWTMFYPLEPPGAFPEEASRHLVGEEALLP